MGCVLTPFFVAALGAPRRGVESGTLRTQLRDCFYMEPDSYITDPLAWRLLSSM